MIRILLLNGPPRSGKDAIGHALAQRIRGSRIVKMAEYLKLATHRLYDCVSEACEDAAFYELVKDQPLDVFFGLTPRQAYIHVSESYFKPIHGSAFFGDRLVETIKGLWESDARTFIVTDCGFKEEVVPLIYAFKPSSISILQLRRKGTSFSSDSRGYLSSEFINGHALNSGQLYNDETIELAAEKVIKWFCPQPARTENGMVLNPDGTSTLEVPRG